MSYDLNFWKYNDGIALEHQVVYERLSDGKHVEGLEELPIGAMLERLKDLFADGWRQVDETTWENERRGAFQIFTTPQFFRVDCYGMRGEDMNRLIDLGAEFGCPLYDPQAGVRFDGNG
ncbi:hypothetical protein [Billgrantia lactosivorans]|uniref:hypothetical protein n=1 Tax=Billgrantia lactosivorans TaxID=2185141 RepID=UPI000DAB440C|nr:hypothetical protein [Halomonas lactosivorans]